MSKQRKPSYRPNPKGETPIRNISKSQPTATKTAASTTAATPAEWPWIALALIFTFLFFYPSLNAGFVNWDDEINVLDNAMIKNLSWQNISQIFSSHVIGNYNPLTILSFAIQWALFGNNPAGFHWVNLLFHLINVYLIFKLSRRLNAPIWAAFVVTCLFGFHPMRVESVTWITELKDVQYTFFFLLALLIYAKHSTKTIFQQLIMLALMALACLSKIQAVTLPLSMLAIDLLRHGKWTLKDFTSKAHFFLTALFMGLLGIYFLKEQGSLSTINDGTNFSFLQRIILGIFTYGVYVVKSLIPFRLSPLYPYPAGLNVVIYLGATLTLMASIFVLYRWKSLTNLWKFGLVFFTVNVMFMLQILGAGQGYLADRFTYVAYFGLFFIYGQELYRLRTKGKQWANMIAYAGLLIYGIMTFTQTKIWKNSETLWTHVLKYYQKSTLPYWNRANYLRSQNRKDEALKDYNEALRLNPTNGQIHNSRGRLFFDGKEYEKAKQDYIEAIKSDSTVSEYWVNLASSHAAAGQLQEAIPFLNKAVQLDPKNMQAYKIRFITFLNLNQPDLAFKDSEQAIELGLRESDMYHERGLIYFNRQQFQKAIEEFTEAINLQGKNMKIYYNARAEAYMRLGDNASANSDRNSAKQF